ncbi:hypothetical protein F511_33500 [Dorcoceras hygrometricum]|uniref:Uncharacterized protein n=1 Tax=Dorcoceras hygrometricum TaxID=472368 RepID=A0A2Z7CFN0_9LAMI|nr:hypothetical protein F511_33500 [Dorcoceras hygrometricum]
MMRGAFFSQKGVQIDVHGKKKYMKHEFRLLNDILEKAITVKAGSFDFVTVERFQMMTAIQYGLKVNWGKVLFNVLKDMVDRSQKKAKGFAAQIGVLLKGIPAITMGDGVPFPSAKVLSMRTVHTYIVTNTTIDGRTESEEPGMAKTPKAKKKPSSADEMPIDMFAEFTASKKRSATEANAPIITKKRRTGKSKPSVSQANLDIVQVATDVEPIQIVDPTNAAATEIIKEANAAVVISTVDADIAKVLEETLALGVTATERESQGFDEALFEEDFARWLDDFVARHNEPELNGKVRVLMKHCLRKTLLDGWMTLLQDTMSQNWLAQIKRHRLRAALSDVSTVYRSPYPPSPGVDSLEHDLRFALGPAIFSRVEQEECLYFVQSPESPPAVSPHHASSSSSTDVSLHFDSSDVLMHDPVDHQAPASVEFTKFTEALEDIRSSLAQRIDNSNCEMLSKINAVEVGVRGDIPKCKACFASILRLRVEFLSDKKKQREQDARLIAMDEQIAAIRNKHLDFQSKIAADIPSLSTQVGDIADFLRSGAAKKGEMGSSIRPTTVRAQTQMLPAQTQTLPPTTGTFEERVAQARRHIIETGQVISIEEAAARVIEGDRRESERLDRERRERRQSRSGTYKRRR